LNFILTLETRGVTRFLNRSITPKNKDFSPEGFRKMDIKKVDLLLKYILAAAGQ
jgi:hypothetical protein